MAVDAGVVIKATPLIKECVVWLLSLWKPKNGIRLKLKDYEMVFTNNTGLDIDWNEIDKIVIDSGHSISDEDFLRCLVQWINIHKLVKDQLVIVNGIFYDGESITISINLWKKWCVRRTDSIITKFEFYSSGKPPKRYCVYGDLIKLSERTAPIEQ